MTQHEITKKHPLLNEKGELTECGYARSLILDYDRNAIKANAMRIKEWDNFIITCNDFAIILTIDDNSYMGLDSISLIDFRNSREYTNSPMKFFTFGKKNLPSTSKEGDIASSGKGYDISFVHEGNKRILSFSMSNFNKDKPIKGRIELTDTNDDSIVTVTPFKEDKKAFYYNQKIIAMPAMGKIEYDGDIYEFKEGQAFGLLDWGRGVWTYKNSWYWGAAQGLVDGHKFGFSIGYGFGDTSAASENMLFYDGIAHKIDSITFNLPTKEGKLDLMSPWTITSNDGRFEMEFVPNMDKASKTDLVILCSDQHQVFGKFSGKAVLDDGKVIEIKDFTGFAEKFFNKW